MSGVLERLHQDHANLSQLLDVLDAELAVFSRGDSPDYEIIESAIEYCLNYPDLKHHPIEDKIAERLRDHGAPLDPAVFNLAEEHQSLSELTRRLAAATKSLLLESEIPRDAYVELFRKFLKFYREHIHKEDNYFFPTAAKTLSAKDWDEISRMVELSGDPVFDDDQSERFKALRQSIIRWSASDNALGA